MPGSDEVVTAVDTAVEVVVSDTVSEVVVSDSLIEVVLSDSPVQVVVADSPVEVVLADRGLTGPAATVEVAGTVTGPPGSEASVVNVGTSGDARLVFTVPRGADGQALGGDLHYIHIQGTPSTVWTVQHNLGKHPAVHAEDAGRTRVYGNVVYASDSLLTVTFTVALAGKAYCS